MKNELIKLADHLDKKGLHKEANYLDALLKRAEILEKRASLTKTAGIFNQSDRMLLEAIAEKVGVEGSTNPLDPTIEQCVKGTGFSEEKCRDLLNAPRL
jgi:hypothetical protein